VKDRGESPFVKPDPLPPFATRCIAGIVGGING
jgi:hypothetical protein